MTVRHIAVLTGKRGGYGAMRPMLRALDEVLAHPENAPFRPAWLRGL